MALGDDLRAMATQADTLVSNNAWLTAELVTARDHLNAALSDLVAANARIAELEARIAELEAQQPPPVPPTTYTVKAGDTLFSISQATGVSVADLQAWNGLTNTVITVGQVLRLIAPEPAPDPPPDPVPTSSKIVLGHVALNGSGTWRQKADAVKAKFGPFQGHMRVYWGVGSSGILSAELKAWLDASPSNKLFANWKPWSTSWAQVASGGRDSVIVAAAKSWAPYVAKGQFLLTFGHEPENDGQPPADYVAMWRRAAPLMRANAPGIKLVWTMMGKFSGHPHSLYESLWPGADLVDVIGHDPYIVKGTAPTKLPQNIIDGAKDLRLLPGAANLPVIAAEWGADLGGSTTSRGTDQHRADAIDAVTARLDEIAACGHIEMTFYDDGSSYLSASGPDVAAYKRLKTATENRP